ncbi:MAG: HXXEE domain-containing protein [Myxococcales bacterium]|nr:HXXEE domain-containing protein [Myxococcales bacterium]
MDTIFYGWPWLALVLAPVILAALVLERRSEGAPSRMRDPAFVLGLFWPMYMAHQFEEHGIDLRGRRYSFLASLCATLGYGAPQHGASHVGHGMHVGCPADPAFLFAVNAVAVWLAGAIALATRRSRPDVAAAAWGIAAFNAITHIVASLRTGAYNPGVFTSLVLFIPMSVYMIRLLAKEKILTPRGLIARVMFVGLVTHGVLLASLALLSRGVLSHTAALVINGLNGLVPLVFLLVKPRDGRASTA